MSADGPGMSGGGAGSSADGLGRSADGPGIGGQWPCPAHFEALARTRPVVPVCRRLLADGATPLGLYRALAQDRPGTFLLESAQLDGSWARYSIVGVRPAAVLSSDDGRARWTGTPPPGCPESGPFAQVLDESLAALASPADPGLPPLTGGFVGSLGYDVVRQWERIDAPSRGLRHETAGPGEGQRQTEADAPKAAKPAEVSVAKPAEVPDAYVVATGDLAVLDHRDASVYLISNVYTGAPGFDATAALRAAAARLDDMQSDLARPADLGVTGIRLDEDIQPGNQVREDDDLPSGGGASSGGSLERLREGASEPFRAGVERTLAAIEDGEVFQLVLSQRFELENHAKPLDVYRALRLSNPSPYLYLLRCQDAQGEPYAVVGASPEALVTAVGDAVYSHPIAGTRPRGANTAEDEALEAELLADDKERAEHLMLVDLARNDLARVCEPDSIEVSEFMAVERFSHVMHLVSTVIGRRRGGFGPLAVLRAAFPAGTLTGAPKIRAMQLIDELEETRRGVYGGVVGYLAYSGNLDTAIAIRSALLRPGRAIVQAGAGIVADSSPAGEDAECRAKASAVIAAIGLADRFQLVERAT